MTVTKRGVALSIRIGHEFILLSAVSEYLLARMCSDFLQRYLPFRTIMDGWICSEDTTIPFVPIIHTAQALTAILFYIKKRNVSHEFKSIIYAAFVPIRIIIKVPVSRFQDRSVFEINNLDT